VTKEKFRGWGTKQKKKICQPKKKKHLKAKKKHKRSRKKAGGLKRRAGKKKTKKPNTPKKKGGYGKWGHSGRDSEPEFKAQSKTCLWPE